MPQMNTDTGKDKQTFAIIGAAMAVHSRLGSGFLEAVYQDALEVEFESLNVPYEREVKLEIVYRGVTLPSFYRADFICYGEVFIKLKAVSGLDASHSAQVINYLKATGLQRGLLLIFTVRDLNTKDSCTDESCPS